MTLGEHERILELLAGHVLHALGEEDASEAEGLLASHVPSCPECSAELEGMIVVAGELALAAGSRRPAHLLGVRIRRGARARRTVGWLAPLAAAAAVVALASVFAWNVRLSGRVSHAEDRQARTTEVLTLVAHPRSRVVPLNSTGAQLQSGELSAVYVPDLPQIYIFGSLDPPSPGRVYQVWLVQEGRFHSAAVFVPESGAVLLKISVNPAVYDGLLITEEPGQGSEAPSERRVGMADF